MRIVRNATANFSEQIHEIFIEEGIQGINDFLFYLMGTDFFPFETTQSMWVLMCNGKEAPHHPYVLNQVPEELLMFRQFEQWYREQTW